MIPDRIVPSMCDHMAGPFRTSFCMKVSGPDRTVEAEEVFHSIPFCHMGSGVPHPEIMDSGVPLRPEDDIQARTCDGHSHKGAHMSKST